MNTTRFLSDRLIFVSLLAALLINIILWVVLSSKFGLSTRAAPLHWSVIYGIDFVGSSRAVYELPLTGLAIFFVNASLAKLLHSHEKILAYILVLVSLTVECALLIGGVAITVLNR